MPPKRSATREPRQTRSMQTKQQILAAGTKLFTEKGFHQTNSNEIAKAAGVAVGSFYAYFKDKKTLFIEIMKVHYEEQFRFIELPEENLAGVDRRAMIHRLIKSLAELHNIAPEIHQEQYYLAHTDADIQALIDEWDQAAHALILSYLQRWLADGYLRVKDLDTAVRLFGTTVEENIHALKFSKAEVNETRVINELTDMLCRYLFVEEKNKKSA